MKRPPTTRELLPPNGATPLDMVIVAQARPDTPAWATSLRRVKAWVRDCERMRARPVVAVEGGLFNLGEKK